MIELDTTQMKPERTIDEIADALLAIENGIARLHEEFKAQPDGPLNFWAIYDLKRHADQFRSCFASLRRLPLPPSPIITDDRIDTRNHSHVEFSGTPLS